MYTPDLKVAMMSATNGQRLRTRSHVRSDDDLRPLLSWAAEAADPRELQQHYDMVVMVVEKILSRDSPKHRTRETGSASKGRKMPTKGHMRASVRVCV